MQMPSLMDSSTSLIIVDEDLGFAANAKQILEPLGIDVALSDADDIENFRDLAPQLVIISAELPQSGASGFSLCNRLRREEVFAETKILITSDGSSQEALSHHVKIPERADAYTHKPISDEQLRREVLALLSDTYIPDEDEDSVAFIADDEVLEVEPAHLSSPPPLPEFNVQPWQAMHFDEMVRQRCQLEVPRPSTQPDPDARMSYLRDRVRFLEERDKATRVAWDLIQDQGKEMERQAAAARFAAQRQHQTLVETQERLLAEKDKFARFNDKVSVIFDAKDTEEATLKAQLEKKNQDLKRRQNIVEHLQEQLENSARQHLEDENLHEELRTQMADQAKDYEEKQQVEAQNHQQDKESQNADHAEALTDLSQKHADETTELKADFDNQALLMETEHTGLILEITREREDMVAALQKDENDKRALEAKAHEKHKRELIFMAKEELQSVHERSEERAAVFDALSVQLQHTKRMLQDENESLCSNIRVLEENQAQARVERGLQAVEISQGHIELQDVRNRLETAQSRLETARIENEDHIKRDEERRENVSQLAQELSDLYLELEDLQSGFSLLEVRYTEATGKLKVTENEKRDAGIAQAKFEAQNQTLHAQNLNLKERHKETEETLRVQAQKADQVEGLEKKLDDAHSAIEQVTSEKEAAEHEKRQTKIALEQSQEAEEQSDKDRQTLQEEMEALRKAQADSAQRAIELTEEREQDEEKNTLLRQQLDELNLQLEHQTEELEQAESSNRQFDEASAQLEADSQTAKEEMLTLTEALEKAQNANLQLNESSAELEAESLAAKQEILTLTEALEKAQNANLQLKKSSAELETESLAAKQEILTLTEAHNRNAGELEGEISDTQDSLYAQLEQVKNLQQALQEADNVRTALEAEGNTSAARLKSAIERIDQLEIHLFESETAGHGMRQRLGEAVAERNQARAELALRDSQVPDTEKPQRLSQEKHGKSKKNMILQPVDQGLQNAKEAVEPQVHRLEEEDPNAQIALLPTRQEENDLQTTTEADLPEEYFRSLEKYRSQPSISEPDMLYLDDAAIIEIDAVDNEEDDDTNIHLGDAGIHCTELESAMGIQAPVEEDTRPFGQVMSAPSDGPLNNALGSQGQDALAALEALEYTAGTIDSPRDADPFVHLSELPRRNSQRQSSGTHPAEGQEERKTTDVLHVDETE
jgi:hypothetical protein